MTILDEISDLTRSFIEKYNIMPTVAYLGRDKYATFRRELFAHDVPSVKGVVPPRLEWQGLWIRRCWDDGEIRVAIEMSNED